MIFQFLLNYKRRSDIFSISFEPEPIFLQHFEIDFPPGVDAQSSLALLVFPLIYNTDRKRSNTQAETVIEFNKSWKAPTWKASWRAVSRFFNCFLRLDWFLYCLIICSLDWFWLKHVLFFFQKWVQIKPSVLYVLSLSSPQDISSIYVLSHVSPQYISSCSQAHLVLIQGTLV